MVYRKVLLLSKSVNRLHFFSSITVVKFWDWGRLGGGGTTPFYLSFYCYVGGVFGGGEGSNAIFYTVFVMAHVQ